MKKTSKKFIILLLFASLFVYSQNVKVSYDRTFTDTSAVGIHETIMLRFENFPNNTNRCELIEAFATNQSNQKIQPSRFLSQANREFWITFKKNKNFKKLISINGKARFYTISKEKGTLLLIDSILEKIDKTIYLKDEAKVIVLDIESLKSKKEKKPIEYKNEIARIIKDNKLNPKWFEDALKKTFENYYDLFNMMIYCEDPKNNIADVDYLFTEYNTFPDGVNTNFIKTFLFSKSYSSNQARISIKNSDTFKEIEFKVILDNDEE